MSNGFNYIVKKYPLDIPQALEGNKIEDEEHDLDTNQFPVIIPKEGSFFNRKVTVRLNGRKLVYGIDYQFDALNEEATRVAAKSIYDAIVFRRNLKGKLKINYHVIGEPYVNRVAQIQRLYNLYLGDDRPVIWGNITNKPDGFPCIDHYHYGWDIKEWGALTIAVLDNTQALIKMHSTFEARIDKLVKNKIVDVDNQLGSLLDLINLNSHGIALLKEDAKRLGDGLTQLSNDFYAEDWVPDTRKINGHPLKTDINLNNIDVGAIGRHYKDTFAHGFNDELTNIGKQVNTPTRFFGSVDDIKRLPVGYHGYVGRSDNVYFPFDFGYMHKLGIGEANNRSLIIFYEDTKECRVWRSHLHDYHDSLHWEADGDDMAGKVSIWFGSTPPRNHSFLHGQMFDKWKNPVLAGMFTNGTLPDARGMFMRGLDLGRGLDYDPGRWLGHYQEDAMKHLWGQFAATCWSAAEHFCTGVFYDTGYRNHGDSGEVRIPETIRYGFDNSRIGRTASETTVKNLAVNYIITMG
jgi:hypothetical protein